MSQGIFRAFEGILRYFLGQIFQNFNEFWGRRKGKSGTPQFKGQTKSCVGKGTPHMTFFHLLPRSKVQQPPTRPAAFRGLPRHTCTGSCQSTGANGGIPSIPLGAMVEASSRDQGAARPTWAQSITLRKCQGKNPLAKGQHPSRLGSMYY